MEPELEINREISTFHKKYNMSTRHMTVIGRRCFSNNPTILELLGVNVINFIVHRIVPMIWISGPGTLGQPLI
jgi:hypothetical protein